ncbi:MAG: O-antigen ligase family protein [Alphaproteobacteria bacterium]|nr:O-antigen ligase family protein [Alphaproteobacteria bacterium]
MRFWAPALFGLLSALPVLIALHMARGVAPLFVVMAVFALAWHVWPQRHALTVGKPYLFLLAAFCLWAILSALWAFDPVSNGLGALRMGALMLGGLFLVSSARRLDEAQARLFRRFFILAYVVILLLIAIDLLSGMQILRLSYALRGIYPAEDFNFSHDAKHRAVLLALLLPPAFLAARHEAGLKWTLGLAALAALVIAAHRSETAILCLLAGPLAALLAFLRPKPVLWAGLIGLTVLFAAPAALMNNPPSAQAFGHAHPELSPSLRHRFAIWEYALGRISERPILGHGFDAAREIGGREPKRHLDLGIDFYGHRYTPYFEPIPLHTHNGVIQLWLELGAVGAVIGAALLMLAWKGALSKADPLRRAGSVALFATAMVPMLSSYGLFQNWWVGSVWIALAALETETGA